MAKPRIFVSSTYYDLKHLRSSIENFVERLGYEPVLSEKGDIAYTPDAPLDESCYREVKNADVFVLIVGGRYGSEVSREKKKVPSAFYERYESITKNEFKSALAEDIPVYILIESNVYSEYHTFLKNKENTAVTYAHVDSVNIFLLIEEILSQPRNNPVKTFERYSDIEEWLQEQWAGLFKELLNRMTGQKQLTALSAQVLELAEVNKTLRTYLEAVVAKITPEASAKLIRSERKRLDQAKVKKEILSHPLVGYLTTRFSISIDIIADAVAYGSSLEEFFDRLRANGVKDETLLRVRRLFEEHPAALPDLNRVRDAIGASPFEGHAKVPGDGARKPPSVELARAARIRRRRSVKPSIVPEKDSA